MLVRSSLAISILALAACGGDDGGGVDAPKADASGATVMTVTCPSGNVPTITTLASAFDMPTLAISQNGIVKFVSTATHPVAPFPGPMTDPGIVVPEGQTRCLQFTATGTFKFICRIHSYLGTITVN
jgi:plastocyanin